MPSHDSPALSQHDLFYLRSIKRNLDELNGLSASMAEATGYGTADAALDDNRNWLNCFIDQHERMATNQDTEATRLRRVLRDCLAMFEVDPLSVPAADYTKMVTAAYDGAKKALGEENNGQ